MNDFPLTHPPGTDSQGSFLPKHVGLSETPADSAGQVEARPLVGIARLAAESEHADERNKVDYHWIECRSTLNRVNGTRVGFEWSINPYRGCEFGCVYCYARYTHDFMELHDPMDFERKVFIKRDAAQRLEAELRRGRYKEGETIVLGAATDPYQPAERRFEATREILKVLARRRGFRIGLTTKSDLVLRDLELWQELAARHAVAVRVTITTTDIALARELEPRAVTPVKRIEAIQRLNEAGIPTGVNLMPVMAWINDSADQLDAVAAAGAQAGARYVGYRALFLTHTPRLRFFAYLQEKHPDLVERYRRWYAGNSDAPDEYRRALDERMQPILKRHGLHDRWADSRKDELDPEAAPSPFGADSQPDMFG